MVDNLAGDQQLWGGPVGLPHTTNPRERARERVLRRLRTLCARPAESHNGHREQSSLASDRVAEPTIAP